MSAPHDDELAAKLEAIATSYMPAFVLFATIELGVFDALDEPASLEALARRTRTEPDGMRRLCRVLCSMGLVSIEGDHVKSTPAARAALSRGGSSSIAHVIRHHQRHVAPLFQRLSEAVRTGAAQHRAWGFATTPVEEGAYAELAKHPEELATFLSAMDRSSRGVGTALVSTLRALDVQRLIDLGCGGGVVAREILSAMPLIRVESFDLAPACEIALTRSRDAGFGERHRVRPGDLLEGVEARGADAVLLSAILADWTEDERARILAGARRNLRSGGNLFISETLLDDDGAGPAGAAMLSLVMLLAMRGDQLSGAMLRAEVERAGFVDVRVERGGPRDLVIASAP